MKRIDDPSTGVIGFEHDTDFIPVAYTNRANPRKQRTTSRHMADHDFSVRPFEARDIDDIRRLWAHVYSEDEIEIRTRILEWFTRENPHRSADSPGYFMLLDGEEVVGFHGQAAWQFAFSGNRVSGAMCYDDMLSPDYRGKGLGKIMLDQVAALRPEFTGALWHNDANHRLYSKCGWVDVQDFRPHLKICDPRPMLASRFGDRVARFLAPFARAVLALRQSVIPTPRARGIRFQPVERFDERFDNFFDAVASEFPAIAVRDSSYLNWKFVDRPSMTYQRLAAIDESGGIAGYVVFRRQEREGIILDGLADPRTDTFTNLVEAALGALEADGVDSVRIACTHPGLARSLRSLGFIESRRPLHFMIIHADAAESAAPLTAASSWYVTYSDGDGDCWAVE